MYSVIHIREVGCLALVFRPIKNRNRLCKNVEIGTDSELIVIYQSVEITGYTEYSTFTFSAAD